eukprot:g34066.t1
MSQLLHLTDFSSFLPAPPLAASFRSPSQSNTSTGQLAVSGLLWPSYPARPALDSPVLWSPDFARLLSDWASNHITTLALLLVTNAQPGQPGAAASLSAGEEEKVEQGCGGSLVVNMLWARLDDVFSTIDYCASLSPPSGSLQSPSSLPSASPSSTPPSWLRSLGRALQPLSISAQLLLHTVLVDMKATLSVGDAALAADSLANLEWLRVPDLPTQLQHNKRMHQVIGKRLTTSWTRPPRAELPVHTHVLPLFLRARRDHLPKAIPGSISSGRRESTVTGSLVETGREFFWLGLFQTWLRSLQPAFALQVVLPFAWMHVERADVPNLRKRARLLFRDMGAARPGEGAARPVDQLAPAFVKAVLLTVLPRYLQLDANKSLAYGARDFLSVLACFPRADPARLNLVRLLTGKIHQQIAVLSSSSSIARTTAIHEQLTHLAALNLLLVRTLPAGEEAHIALDELQSALELCWSSTKKSWRLALQWQVLQAMHKVVLDDYHLELREQVVQWLATLQRQFLCIGVTLREI